MRLAIVFGVSDYATQLGLPACKNDAEAIDEVLRKSGRYQDICLLTGNIAAAHGKKSIAEFVTKHHGQRVSELFFFFSGHGSRFDGDFWHIFSDFSSRTREATSLRNSELDGLIRNLAPELTVKVVDACFSGSQYIKNDEDVQPALEKSAKDASLKKLYFLHSSSSSEESLAGPSYSIFTASVLQTIAGASGELRYRDLMAGVADDLAFQQVPKPTFVVQADNLETFVDVTKELSEAVRMRLAAPIPGGSSKDSIAGGTEPGELAMDVRNSEPTELAELAKTLSDEVFCTEQEATSNIKLLDVITDLSKWPKDILAAFDRSETAFDAANTPNGEALGRWLVTTKKSDELFAEATYHTEAYEAEEYQLVPKKPKGMRDTFASFNVLFGNDPDYKLAKVTKHREVLTGFRYTVDPVFVPRTFRLVPKFSALENYALSVLCFFSRRMLHVVYSVEHLPLKDWNDVTPIRAIEWKTESVSLKDRAGIERLIETVLGSVSEFIRTDANRRLGALKTQMVAD